MFGWLRQTAGEYATEIGFSFGGLTRPWKNLFNKRPSFREIHYYAIIGMTILNSIIIYGGGINMPYIDALFFASGSATQSGLNTIDVNTLYTYQQVFICLSTFACTPIFINTMVVHVRLYWFERKFQDTVREARLNRQSRTRSFSRTFSRSMARNPVDVERGSQGVNGRHIEVIRSSLHPVEEVDGFSEKRTMPTVPESSSDSGSAGEEIGADENIHSPRAIRFPDDVSGRDDSDRHIAFVQRQRNEEDSKPLRIPGPREADEGAVPEEVEGQQDDDQDEEVDRPHGILKNRAQSQSHSLRPNVTIEEPERPVHSNTNEGRHHRRIPSNPYAHKVPTAPNENDATSTLRKRRGSASSMRPSISTEAAALSTVSYLSYQPTIGRNSLFIDLTDEQREELGGIEYRALKLLIKILWSYYIGFHLFGFVILAPWIVRSQEYGSVVDAVSQNRVWWALFSSSTFFNDLGFTLTPDSFISFKLSVLVMLLGSFLIVIGNTGFPCMLRFVIWLVSLVAPKDTPLYEELRFLLDHPRRCFTLLFPAQANRVLFGILVLLNVIDLIFFVILDINDATVSSLPPSFQFLDGLFQAFSTRTAGTACVNVADLHPAIQVSYLVMMYISVLPIAISVRRTNVYEERSLGVFSTTGNDNEDDPNYVGQHVRNQLSFDLPFIFLGLFIIAIAEGDRIADTTQPYFTLFPILFEIVSAYGTVGLSLGYPGINASFSAELDVVSKLVIIAMQIRGRHRGLPYDLDRAILLPSEGLHRREQEEAERRLRRTSTLNLDESGNQHQMFRTPTHNSTSRAANENSANGDESTQSGRQHGVPELMRERQRVGRGIRAMAGAAEGITAAGRKIPGLLGDFARIGPKKR